MRKLTSIVATAWLALVPAAAAEPLTVVACAPGYPGNTEQAQPAMDEFAAALGRSLGAAGGDVRAVYDETLESGLQRLAADDAAVAMVPLPFYLQYRETLELRPLVSAVPTSGETERWSLVARTGAVDGPAALDDWVVAGMAGYSPRFVRNVALAGWGRIPDGTKIEFTSRVLSSLRHAAGGENVAVLLDRAQAEALGSLPFAAELQVVTRSAALPATVVCSVGQRLGKARSAELVASLVGLDEAEGGAEALAGMRMVRFEPVDREALGRAEAAFSGSPN